MDEMEEQQAEQVLVQMVTVQTEVPVVPVQMLLQVVFLVAMPLHWYQIHIHLEFLLPRELREQLVDLQVQQELEELVVVQEVLVPLVLLQLLNMKEV